MEATAPLDTALADLQDLVLLRRHFVDELASLSRIEQELGAKAGPRQRAEVLRSIPGVGSATWASLLAAMPELGGLGRRGPARCGSLRP